MKKIVSLSLLIASMLLIPLTLGAARGGGGGRGGMGGGRGGMGGGVRGGGMRSGSPRGVRMSGSGFPGVRVSGRSITGTRITGPRGITGTRISRTGMAGTRMGRRGVAGQQWRRAGIHRGVGGRRAFIGAHRLTRNHWGWGDWRYGRRWIYPGFWWWNFWGPNYWDNYPYLVDIDYSTYGYAGDYWTVINNSSYTIVVGTYDGSYRGLVRSGETIQIPGDSNIVIGQKDGQAHVFEADPGEIINVTDDMID